MKTLTGIVRGRTIELAEAPGVTEGQQVLVQLTVMGGSDSHEQLSYGTQPNDLNSEDDRILDEIQQSRSRAPVNGLVATEGALVDDDEWDAIMDEIHQSRKWERTSGNGQR